jgi:hypothetical protein
VETTTIIPGELSEGEKEKIIQVPENNTTTANKDVVMESEPENDTNKPVDSESQNTVPFPSASETSDLVPSDDTDEAPDEEPKLGRGHRVAKKPKGASSRMHNALPPLPANVVYLGDPDDNGTGLYLPESDNDDIFTSLPPGFANVGAMGSEPASIDEALRGLNADKWQVALDYEINQLEKLGTWVIEDLPEGEIASWYDVKGEEGSECHHRKLSSSYCCRWTQTGRGRQLH